ncbi:LysR family transcriptional regulator [Spirillospora sp. NPDC048819]|uniref:LysR family transcriptional regulator n=1 Tax=Spirillospora sp. NPDC048819 TaxID=3155268 RepID=UPI0033D6B62D
MRSALRQQIQRLERELGVRLLERTTHYVALTPAGAAFLVEARQILAHVECAAQVARTAEGASPALRVGIIDASYDSMPSLRAPGNDLAPAHRTGLLLSLVDPVARGRRFRSRARRRRLRPEHVRRTRLGATVGPGPYGRMKRITLLVWPVRRQTPR